MIATSPSLSDAGSIPAASTILTPPSAPRQAYALAALYLEANELALAEPLHVRALKIREKALGQDHPETAKAKADYAELLRRTGRFDEAAELDQSANE